MWIRKLAFTVGTEKDERDTVIFHFQVRYGTSINNRYSKIGSKNCPKSTLIFFIPLPPFTNT
jgi:hypothetical protein